MWVSPQRLLLQSAVIARQFGLGLSEAGRQAALNLNVHFRLNKESLRSCQSRILKFRERKSLHTLVGELVNTQLLI